MEGGKEIGLPVGLHVYISDCILVYTTAGDFIITFGSHGQEVGQFHTLLLIMLIMINCMSAILETAESKHLVSTHIIDHNEMKVSRYTNNECSMHAVIRRN